MLVPSPGTVISVRVLRKRVVIRFETSRGKKARFNLTPRQAEHFAGLLEQEAAAARKWLRDYREYTSPQAIAEDDRDDTEALVAGEVRAKEVDRKSPWPGVEHRSGRGAGGDALISFKSIGQFDLRDSRGRVFVVELDRETSDFSHLLGKRVEIDGRRGVVRSVERFAHSPPWRAGERVGLLFEETPPKRARSE